MTKKLSLSVFLFFYWYSGTSFSSTGSTELGRIVTTQRVHRCYGATQPTQQNLGTLTYTNWWRCDGTNVTNQFITCPAGYVSVGIYTWHYTNWLGKTMSRCRAACSQVTAYVPPTNCVWENRA